MNFHPFEVTIPHIIYACLGGFVVLFGMFSLLLRERLYIGEACWAFLFGVIIGPYCANVFDPRSWGNGNPDTVNTITLEFTRVVLAIGVFAIGVELPKAYMARHWKSLFFLLFPVMTWGWFVSAGLIYAFIPGLSFLSSLAVAACLTPTDPILAAAVVGGKWADKHVPAHIRHLLAAESGCNDGAAYPFLFIALYLILDKNTGHAIRDWFLLLWLYQVVVGILIGGLLGFAFRHLMKYCQRHDLIDRHSYVAQYVSLAMLTIGVCSLLGSDDLLAAFSCGTAFAWDGFFNRQTEESVFSSVIDLLFNVAAFVFVGAWMPFNKFQDAELTLSVWRLIVIAILVLLLKRLPVMIALYKFIPDVKTFRESLFTGHFGPIGIGAVFISTLASEVLHKGGDEDPQTVLLRDTIQPIVAFMVLCSITIHGLSIPSFSLGRRVHSVSRTWSRRDTTDGIPDWTNQTRRVTRPEEIVINRDHVDIMEKGEIGVDNNGAKEGHRRTRESSRTEFHTGEEEGHMTEGKERPGRRDTDEGSAETKVNGTLGEHHAREREDYREEALPDGAEDYLEWIEPHHRIIERRQGPGSEVDVTVLNESNEEATASESNLSLQHLSTRSGQQKQKQKPAHDKTWKMGASAVHGELERLEHASKSVEDKIKGKIASHRRRGSEPLPSSPSSLPKTSESSGNDDDDEGWASEASDNGPMRPSSITGIPLSAKAEGKKRARGSLGIGRKGRQRLSFRRSSTGEGSGHHRDRADDDEEATESRGRSGGKATSWTRPRVGGPIGAQTGFGSGRPRTADSAINQRLETIRRQASRPPTREASPSRSVRFVDDPGDGATLSARSSRMWGDLSPTSPRSPEAPASPTVEKTDSSASSSPSLGGGKK